MENKKNEKRMPASPETENGAGNRQLTENPAEQPPEEAAAAPEETLPAQDETNGNAPQPEALSPPDSIPAREKPKNRKTKYGAYAAAFTALFVAGVIVVNVIASVLAARFPLSLDLTSGKDFSISEQNKQYITDISQDVTITVGANREDFTNGYYSQVMYYNTYLQDQTGGKYYQQFVELLDSYAKLNSHIKVRYLDAQSPEFSAITQKYQGEQLGYGSVLVESAPADEAGKTTEQHKVLGFSDLFSFDQQNYVLTGSTVESAVTSAIYNVSSTSSETVVILSGHNEEDLSAVYALLQTNNYATQAVENLLTQEIPEDASAVIIAAPTTDYSAEEIQKLDAYLKGEGLGKTLLYFASASQPVLPKLEEYLAEWGFRTLPGAVYETDSQMHYPDQNTAVIGLSTQQTEYTAALDSQQYIYIADNNRPIQLAFDSQNGYTTQALVTTSSTAVRYPFPPEEGWSPETAEPGPFSIMALSQYTQDGTAASNVLMISAPDFLNSIWSQYTNVGNQELTLTALGSLSGRLDSGNITFTAKTISVRSFADQVTAASSLTLTIFFMVLIPLGVIILGTVIWMRRRRL